MDNFSFRILQIFLERNYLSLVQLSAILNKDSLDVIDAINYLRQKGYLQIEPSHAMLNKISNAELISPDTPLCITYDGKVALEFESKQRKYLNYNEIRAWITLSVAVFAFFLSIFSLYLQYR